MNNNNLFIIRWKHCTTSTHFKLHTFSCVAVQYLQTLLRNCVTNRYLNIFAAEEIIQDLTNTNEYIVHFLIILFFNLINEFKRIIKTFDWDEIIGSVQYPKNTLRFTDGVAYAHLGNQVGRCTGIKHGGFSLP